MSSMTLGIDGGTCYHQKSEILKESAYAKQTLLNNEFSKSLKSYKINKTDKPCQAMLFSNNLDSLIISEIYNPMNLANIICNKFEYHQEALIKAFMQDLQMFEYLYEFLPKDISVEVINNISFDKAVGIVRRRQSSTYVYDRISPILYVVRYFSDLNIVDPMAKDYHCATFDKSIIPKNDILNFVLKCKEFITENEFEKLVRITTN